MRPQVGLRKSRDKKEGALRLLTVGERDVLTGKLFHVPHYRSVFMNVRAPHMPVDGKLRKTA